MRAARARLARVARLLFALLPLVALVGCRVDAGDFERRVFRCDTAAPDPLCGTDSAGKAMTCFAARQIGGADFCTPACGDVPMSLPAEDAVCVQGNAKLRACRPEDDQDLAAHPLGACDRRDLGCLRTDVLANEGVCITGKPCLTNDDCHDPVRSKCAATFLKEVYTGAPDLTSDHLYCLQEGCINGNTACSPGETCLPKVIPPAGHPPDICVPNCDSHGRCPPNHFCLSTISGPANPAVCIPGLLGFVCQTDVDCLLGTCINDEDPDAARGLKLCSVACTSDADCAKFDSQQGRFVCSAATGAAEGRHCITPDSYTGALCRSNADCLRDVGTICAKTSATTANCLRPCSATKPCAPRGGIGHTCLPLVGDDLKPALVCLPGFFPYPCFDNSQCAVADLACAGVNLSDPQDPKPGNCTRICASDADCQTNKWTAGQSYCGAPTVPVCLPLRDDGAACLADKQCQSQRCAVPPSGVINGSTDKTCGGQ